MLLLPQLGATDSQRFVGAKTTHKRHTSVIKFGLAFGLGWHELLLSGAATQMYIACQESPMHMLRHATLQFRSDGRDCWGSFEAHLRSPASVILKVLEVPEGSFIEYAGVARFWTTVSRNTRNLAAHMCFWTMSAFQEEITLNSVTLYSEARKS